MILGIDGIRAIAFLLVFGFHSEYIQFGWVGVQLFFVLSGFLITAILSRMKKSPLSATEYFVKFYGRRFLRIFPLYYFYLAIMLALSVFFLQIRYKPGVMDLFQRQLPYALGYVYNFHYASEGYNHLYFLVHFWSLSVEEQFYIFWPLVIFLVPEKCRKLVFGGMILFGPLFRILVTIGYKYGFSSHLNALLPMGVYPLTLNHLDAFAFGAFIALYPISKARLQAAVLTILLPISAFLWQFLAMGRIDSLQSLGFQFIMPVKYQFIWGYTALNYYFAVIIYAVAKEGLLVGFLENPILKYLGRISYGLYVYHNGVLWLTNRVRDLGIEEGIVKPLSTILAFTITLVLASLTYQFVEKPFLRLKDRYFQNESRQSVDILLSG